jgi:hypothetical protein
VLVVKNGTNLEKKQAKPILFGSSAFLLLGTSTNVILPHLGISAPELGTTFSIVWAISVFYAVIKHKLFILELSVEEPMQVPEKYSLKGGQGYLVREDIPEKGYDIFYDQITHNALGLCISKFYPNKVRERYNLLKTPIIWLTFKDLEKTISPRDVDGLTSVVSDFIRRIENPIVFFDCIDQIKFANGFGKTLSMLKDFAKLCAENNSIMLISLPPAMFEKQQLETIQYELKK